LAEPWLFKSGFWWKYYYWNLDFDPCWQTISHH